MAERQYDKALRLISEASKNIAELGDLFKSPRKENLTEDEQKNLQLSLLKLIVVIKEFGKGEVHYGGKQVTRTDV